MLIYDICFSLSDLLHSVQWALHSCISLDNWLKCMPFYIILNLKKTIQYIPWLSVVSGLTVTCVNIPGTWQRVCVPENFEELNKGTSFPPLSIIIIGELIPPLRSKGWVTEENWKKHNAYRAHKLQNQNKSLCTWASFINLCVWWHSFRF